MDNLSKMAYSGKCEQVGLALSFVIRDDRGPVFNTTKTICLALTRFFNW